MDLKAKMRPYYLMRPRLWGEANLKMIDRRVMLSRRWGYVYLRVPKAANSAVLSALLRRFPEAGLDPMDIDRSKARSQNFRSLRLRELGNVRSCFTFTVVRDPYARTLSAYLDKIATEKTAWLGFRDRIKRFDGGRPSFRAFCRYLATGGEAENPHWMRQTRLVRPADRVDYVGRVETLATDLPRILARVDGSRETAAPSTACHGPAPTHANEKLNTYYDDECRDLVAAVYRADFAQFGYDTHLPVIGSGRTAPPPDPVPALAIAAI
jgi:hypothetical protein